LAGARSLFSTHTRNDRELGPGAAAPPITAIYRQMKLFADSIGETVPSYPAVHRIVRKLPASLLMLAHEGSKAYSESFDLVHRREASGPNAIWQADHAQLDILIVREDGSTARPWLTAVIDDYSRAIAGYYLGFEPPSSLRTSLALRQGIWRKGDPHWHICGIPEVLYTDNGTDFKSRHIELCSAVCFLPRVMHSSSCSSFISSQLVQKAPGTPLR
jgi:putative transposase